ncbi:MAG: NAD(P)H-binding protein [Acidobacteriaceae bacterium]|nr:NAD(P)H-binding protein [Acidobacteriaceae bacterium]MBV9500272.1 NAD(P)H-binding protein [Acidobacteriaceae bacterium]
MQRRIFVTGGTGYIGRALIPLLLHRGHQVAALVRQGSGTKVKPGCEIVTGNALDADSYKERLGGYDTFIHLAGVPHPSPAKAREFVEVDLRSAQGAIRVAANAGIQHFIYLSVAQPAPVMKAYVDVRAACEASLRASGLNATIVRPWYVLGPGHRWPVILEPLYRGAAFIPLLREGATRLGLVTLDQMVLTLAAATEDIATGVRVFEVPDIRRLGAATV